MTPSPRSDAPWYRRSGKLDGRRALVTGGDSGIGSAVARLFAREGADVTIVYLDEHDDAQETAKLLDYSATKGALVAFTRSLSVNLAPRGIRFNAVAPGPTWTPLIPASFSADRVASFGQSTPLGRPGQPDEVAPATSSWPATTRAT